VEDLLHDLRFGFRTVRRYPGFSLAAVLVLGLGIGAPTTVLTLVDRIFFERPEAVSEPHRLVRLWRSPGPGIASSFGNPDFVFYRENVTALQGLAAWGGPTVASYAIPGGRSSQLDVAFASDNYFDVLGVRPARGRFFLPEENAARGSHPVVVLSDALWRALGADAAAVGSSISLNDITFSVIGVAPPGFHGINALGGAPEAWVPIAMRGAVTRTVGSSWWERLPNERNNWLSVAGRLAPGVTFEAAEANLAALSAALEYPGRDEGESVMVSREYLYSPAQTSSLARLSAMLLAVVGIVLAIAIANVAVLLLSRAATRGREVGIRTALGAGRGRLFRQLLAESLVLGAGGGVVGIALAFGLSDAAASLLPYSFAGAFRPAGRVLAAALALTLATALLAGLAPALRAARADVAGSLEGSRVAGGRSRARDSLVVCQVALSLVLLAGAALFTRSFWTARTQDLGFRTENLLVLGVDLRARGYSEAEGLAFIPRAVERLRGLPGVAGVTTSTMIPFQGDWSWDYEPPPGAAPNGPDRTVWIGLNAVSADYFDVMDVPIVRGRPLDSRDGPNGTPSIVVNETLAGLLWPGQEALGKTVPVREGTDFEVVGVAADATYYELGEEPTTQLYGSLHQVYQASVAFILRTAGSAPELASAAQGALREIDPGLAFGSVTTMDSVFEEVTARYRVSAVLVGLFGMLALVLAATGLYGVVSFLVSQRTREIGVRMALGADRKRVARQVLGTGLRLAGLGAALGAVGSFALRGSTESLLYGVDPGDPLPLAAACVALLAVAAVASAGPARRATRVDPMEAIRTD
jgi:predicted permease